MDTESGQPKTLAVVGLGYVGLPVALLARSKGWQVLGVDVDEAKVAAINTGKAPFEDEQVVRMISEYPIEASTDPATVSVASTIIIAVPTPVKNRTEPDLGPLTSALESILPHMRNGQLLSIESTINPGVMEEVVMPILAGRADLSIDVVHCPERINPGDPKWTVANIPRVIGGITPEMAVRGKAFYDQILDADVRAMDSVTEAEAVKIFENTFRDINIAFVNEMAQSFDKLGIDVKNVIQGAATKPFAFMAHYPGSGVGGHCISVDPYYMIERARQVGFDHRFLKLAREINDGMPGYTIQLLDRALTASDIPLEEASVALLGLAYKKNIDDTRESPALAIRSVLESRAKELRVFDPHVLGGSTVDSLEAALTGAHAIVLATDHQEFLEALTPEYIKQHDIAVVIDGKNALPADEIAAAGITYHGIGRSR